MVVDNCYCDLYGKYYNKDKEITKKEYIKITKESSFLIDKLKHSVWPWQSNDYVFVKLNRKEDNMHPLTGLVDMPRHIIRR